MKNISIIVKTFALSILFSTFSNPIIAANKTTQPSFTEKHAGKLNTLRSAILSMATATAIQLSRSSDTKTKQAGYAFLALTTTATQCKLSNMSLAQNVVFILGTLATLTGISPEGKAVIDLLKTKIVAVTTSARLYLPTMLFTPVVTTSKATTAVEITPEEVATKEVTDKKVTPVEITPEEVATKEVTDKKVTPVVIVTEEAPTVEVTDKKVTPVVIVTEKAPTVEVTDKKVTPVVIVTEEAPTVEVTDKKVTPVVIVTEEEKKKLSSIDKIKKSVDFVIDNEFFDL